MTTLAIAVPLGLYAVFLLWRTRVEDGRVHRSAFARFAAQMRLVRIALGTALLPTVVRAVAAMRDFNDEMRKVREGL